MQWEEEAWGRIQEFKRKNKNMTSFADVYIVLMKRVKLNMRW